MAKRKEKLFLVHSDGSHTPVAEFPEPHHEWATFKGACPHCQHAPFRVNGGNKRIASDDRAYEADGHCVDCNKFVGTIRLEVPTLFGLREDEAVLRGRC